MKPILIALLLIAPFYLSAQTKKSKTTAPNAGMATSIARGQKVYLQYCLSCHQIDGGGVPNLNPPLVKTSYVTGDKIHLVKVVLNGFEKNVDIDGESYSNNMPPQNILKDQEIADVLTYVRNSFTNKGTAITVTQVKAVRAKNKK